MSKKKKKKKKKKNGDITITQVKQFLGNPRPPDAKQGDAGGDSESESEKKETSAKKSGGEEGKGSA